MANRKYDEQLQNDAIDAVLIGNKSAAQVARDHTIPESAVYSWIRAYKENSGTRGIRGYLSHEKNVRISRHKIGEILEVLGLKVKTQKKFKKQSTTPINDPRLR